MGAVVWGSLRRGHIQALEVTSMHMGQQGEVDGETPVLVMGSGGTWEWTIPPGGHLMALLPWSHPHILTPNQGCPQEMHEEVGAPRPRLVEPWRWPNVLQANRPPQIQGLLYHYTNDMVIAKSNAPHGKDPPILWHALRPITSQTQEQKCLISLDKWA